MVLACTATTHFESVGILTAPQFLVCRAQTEPKWVVDVGPDQSTTTKAGQVGTNPSYPAFLARP